MAGDTTYDDVYLRFVQIWTNSEPIVERNELAAALRTIRMQPTDVSDELLRSFDADWVYGRSRAPFHDLALDNRYRQLSNG